MKSKKISNEFVRGKMQFGGSFLRAPSWLRHWNWKKLCYSHHSVCFQSTHVLTVIESCMWITYSNLYISCSNASSGFATFTRQQCEKLGWTMRYLSRNV